MKKGQMDMLHLPFCPILVGVREPPGVSAYACGQPETALSG